MLKIELLEDDVTAKFENSGFNIGDFVSYYANQYQLYIAKQRSFELENAILEAGILVRPHRLAFSSNISPVIGIRQNQELVCYSVHCWMTGVASGYWDYLLEGEKLGKYYTKGPKIRIVEF